MPPSADSHCRLSATARDAQVFTVLSSKPVASASLGQVYQATLRPEYGGGCVAVKVQRPGVMEHVALDTLLMRGATEIVSAVPYFSDGWCEVLDDWASRFFQVHTPPVCEPCVHDMVALIAALYTSRIPVVSKRDTLKI